MKEIELKFQVPAGQRMAVEAAVAGRAPKPRMRLQAAYHDTPERTLAEAGLALRMRREGRQLVQTLKGAGDDGMTRAEHNVP
ncbi:MAG: CYTH domain-containing protein, partial [Rhizobiales bacterium]|nr:CYTH domain-containing protein [Rhizobacter sp.]